MSRFELRTGKFGCYFYDTQDQKDIDLNETLKKLNEWDIYVKLDVNTMVNEIESLGGSQ